MVVLHKGKGVSVAISTEEHHDMDGKVAMKGSARKTSRR